MASVRLEKIRKTYANGHVAVAEADFEVADGEFLVLVGPSGCGKSTLLRIIAGLEAPSSGALSIGGRLVNDVAPKDRDIAMVFQNYALYPHMSVAQNMGFGLRLRGTEAGEIERRVHAAAATLGLLEVLARRPAALSGGQRQRVALGRALVRQPAVFLLDEPLSNLDAGLRLTMRAELARLHRRLGTTMIYVTHDQVEAMTLGQRIVVLRDGMVQQIDTPMQVYARPANRFVAGFLGSPPMNFVRAANAPPPVPSAAADVAADVAADAAADTLADAPLTEVAAQPPEAILRQAHGAAVIAGLRPEDLQLDAGAGRSARLRLRLDAVEAVGNEMFLMLRSGADELVARMAPRPVPAPGAPIELFFDPAHLHWFAADAGGRRYPGAGEVDRAYT